MLLRRVVNAHIRFRRTGYSCHGTQRVFRSRLSSLAHHFIASSEEAVSHLASRLCEQGVRAGDVICLFGEVGAGKSVFSRAFIRASARDCTLPVPSPTFLLQNIYDEDVLGSGSVPIHHFDLYRLPPAAGPDEVAMYRLNLDSSFSQACSLIEWPERLMKLMPATYLAVYIQPIINPAPVPGSGHRQVSSTQEAAGNDESDSGDVYADTRPRLISMEPHGGTWHQLLAQLVADLSTVAGQHGLHVLQAELAQGQTELSSRL